MSEIATTLTPEIRGVRSPDRPAGHAVPTGANPNAKPVLVRQADNRLGNRGGIQTDFPVAGSREPARQGAANHFGWRMQAGMEIRSYVETVAARDVAAGATVILDPAIATIWRLTAAGNLTIEVSDLPEMTVGGEPASRVLSLVLYVQRAAGAEITWPAGTLFGMDVLDPDGDGDRSDSLLSGPADASLDVFVLAHVPMIGWAGSVAALGLTVV